MNTITPTSVPKDWGTELWLVNSPLYCAKILQVRYGWTSSFHCHRTKTETFFLRDGIVLLQVGEEEALLYPNGAGITLEPGTYHRFTGLASPVATILEVSTQHDDADVVRASFSRKLSAAELTDTLKRVLTLTPR